MITPLQEFDSFVSSNDILFIVYYRGHWCPFCNTYLRTLQSLTPTITSPHPSLSISTVKIIAVTSEPAAFTQVTRDKTGFQGHVIVDEKNEIAKELKQKGFVDVAISAKKGYQYGMAQPAVVVLGKGGVVLESWAIVPGTMNLGGASDRPDLAQIWDNVLSKLRKEKPAHKTYKTQGALSVLFGKVFA